MKINIDISKEMCDSVLKHYKYTSEKVLLYYSIYENYDPTIGLDSEEEHLRAVEYTIAYPLGERPEALGKDKPKVEDYKEYMYDTVIEHLFNKRLFDVMFGEKKRLPSESELKYR